MGYTPPYLEVRRISASEYYVYSPTSVSGTRLRILANTFDAVPCIILEGTAAITMYGTTSFSNGTGSDYININYDGTDAKILNNIADKNIAITPTGTGKVKFGTFTGSGDVAVNGSISILDSSGNARKLATVA